ncbi:L-aspartate oxidase [Megasphaera hutchinsoni]|uniref:L-aspartate oxidase n=1 Tax=Megasphaera hutchinsoni TaxID=1588748 RepID=A0A2J8BBH2_9FIRM|nr:L-aspartate oxidase [Megasphaera genomosp. type_2]PNH22108.1 L-aspartate oxidase [Megasphaera genomosp. type_2]
MKKYDILIIGSGLAGVSTALELSKNYKIGLVTKKKLADSNSYLAQGGINVLKDESDRKTFIEDTLKAGHYKNSLQAVEMMVDKSQDAIKFLIDLGVEFTKKDGKLEYGQEGGHSIARGLHIDDEIGKGILDVLYEKVKSRSNIDIFEDTPIVDIIVNNGKCYGARSSDEVFVSSNVVLATGGLGGIFKKSTNFPHICGDGYAMAIKNGVKLKDISYIQFHPTSLYEEDVERQFLISESVRGERAQLLNHKSERFTDEMKPRDIVAKAILKEMEKEGVDFEYLSMKPLGENKIPIRFPMIFKELKNRGIDARYDNIPIVPCQHYTMGGIECDINGKTNLKGLFAVGEAGNVGIHGSNRLACNSLLECVVFGRILADYLNENKFEDKEIDFKITDEKIDKEKASEIIFERIREDEKAKSISN